MPIIQRLPPAAVNACASSDDLSMKYLNVGGSCNGHRGNW